MVPVLLLLFIGATTVNPSQAGPTSNDPKELIATIEALQNPIEDVRCEFEGHTTYLLQSDQKLRNLKADGIWDHFTGLFVWRANGDAYSDVFHRYEPEAKISRETIIVRQEKKEAEHFLRQADEPLGKMHIENILTTNANRRSHLGEIFLLDELRRIVVDPNRAVQIKDDFLAGRPVKILETTYIGAKPVRERFWIDLARSGQVVQRETYTSKSENAGHMEFVLKPIRLQDATVWFPVIGEGYGHSKYQDGKFVYLKEPTTRHKIYIINGILEFNQHPASSTFVASYKPGTPITDNLRKIRFEYGQQKVPPRPTKAQTEALLREQIAKANEQKTELVAVPIPETSWNWSLILGGVFGVILVGSLGILFRRR